MKSRFENAMAAPVRSPLPQTTVPFAEQRPVATSGYARFSAPLLEMWTLVVPQREIAHFREFVVKGLNLSMEAYGAKSYEGDEYEDLTVTSLAVVRDTAADALLLLPLALHLGGEVGQVDSHGRTLLHFARTRRMARYLIEQGVPVAKGKREALLEALEKPLGIASFDDDVPLGMVDNVGEEPATLSCVRTSTAAKYTEPEAIALPQSHWKAVLPTHLYKGLVDIGFVDGDATGASGSSSMAEQRPALRAELSPFVELHDALLEGRSNAVRALLELGTDPNLPIFGYKHDGDDGAYSTRLTATAIAVLADCNAAQNRGAGR